MDGRVIKILTMFDYSRVLSALNVIDPDDMNDEYQQVYSQAMADMHAKIIEALVHAANILKDLPSKPEKSEEVRKNKKFTRNEGKKLQLL